MSRNFSFKTSITEEEKKGAQWYIDHYREVNTLQDVVRLLFGKTPDRLVQQTAQLNHKLNEQRRELAEVLQVGNTYTGIISIVRKRLNEIDTLSKENEHLIKEVERVTETSQHWYLLLEQISVMLNHDDFTGFGKPDDFDHANLGFENPVKESVNSLYVQFDKMRKGMSELGKHFDCPANADAIITSNSYLRKAFAEIKETLRVRDTELLEVLTSISERLDCNDTTASILEAIDDMRDQNSENLKTIASKLGVPDTVDHIVQRIDADNSAFESLIAILDIESDSKQTHVPNSVRMLRDANYEKKNVIDALTGIFNEKYVHCPIFPERVADQKNLTEYVEHLYHLHNEREKESKYFMKRLYQPIHKLLWFRFQHFMRGLRLKKTTKRD